VNLMAENPGIKYLKKLKEQNYSKNPTPYG
jgi:hypothetical protein